MMGLRMPELLIIGFVVVLLFGTDKLPGLGAGLGKGIRSFKKAMSGEGEEAAAQEPPADKPKA
ncbi:MAG TPA: twin-arginine translocase TatA/TatE family subunit [Anaeromyxobacteraceae bacterium]|nr:twin-arginine translocase TatA/TatE family subunit [Anaeromyxobacteraceae bacterium]